MDSQYTIRPAVKTDLDRLVELMAALQDHLEETNPDLWKLKRGARTNLKGQVATRLETPETCALVAEHGQDGVVGMAFGRVVTNKRYTPDRAGQVDQAFVRQDHRRAGVGTRLLAELCRFFAQQDVQDISLRYVVGNEQAAGFWISLGFSPRIITAGTRLEAIQSKIDPSTQVPIRKKLGYAPETGAWSENETDL